MTYWKIGQRIIEDEQKGEKRAEYGKEVLQKLSERLTNEYGENTNYSSRDLRNYRQFYLTFNDFPKWYARVPNLTWTHYRSLLRVNDAEARMWYVNEANSETWTTRTLDRNINSQYYFRLLQSPKKEEVIKEMKANTLLYQKDKLEFIKNPIVAEFLGFGKNNDLAQYSILHDNNQLFAAKYLTYLPKKEDLLAEIERQKEFFELQEGKRNFGKETKYEQ